jgi:hypothetical protein
MVSQATHSEAPSVHGRKRHGVTRVVMAVVFWSLAALLVALAHQRLDATSPLASAAIEVGTIVAVAAVYIRIVSPESTLDHALFVGTTWVLLAISAEIIMTASSGRQWFALLGSPAHGGLRCVLLIAWLIAPALFVRHHA